jgi:hypothetical protein
VLAALNGRAARVALMTAIGVTTREGDHNRRTEAHDWKRRGERLVRASGLPYTIVRPGWFDNKPDEHQLVLLQGDRRHAGDPSDGVVARHQIAQLVKQSGAQILADGGCSAADSNILTASGRPRLAQRSVVPPSRLRTSRWNVRVGRNHRCSSSPPRPSGWSRL